MYIKVYIIYIPKRYHYIKNIVLNHYKFNKKNVEFIPGIIPKDFNYTDLENSNIVSKGLNEKNNLNQIATTMSHLLVLDKFINSDQKFCLILEDDIKKQTFNETKFKKIIQNLPKNFDMVYFGRNFSSCYLDEKYSKYFVKSFYNLSTHAYMISKQGANKILNNIKEIDDPIDVMYANLQYNNIIKCFSIKKNIFNQNRTKKGILKSTQSINRLIIPKCLSFKKNYRQK